MIGTSRFQNNLHPRRRPGIEQFSSDSVVVGNVMAHVKEEELVDSFLCLGFLLGVLWQG